MTYIEISINSNSVRVHKFTENAYPRKYTDPSGSFQEDAAYSPKNVITINALLPLEEAVKFNSIYLQFLQKFTAGEDCKLTVTDATRAGLNEPGLTFFAWFEKPPEFFEEGRFIRISAVLREYNQATDDAYLNGAIALSFSGLSLSISQRFMEEKFPRYFIQETVPKIEYAILGATIVTGPPWRGKYIWSIAANLTPAERVALEGILTAYNAACYLRQDPRIAIADTTMGASLMAQGLISEFPKYSYNKESKDRIYKATFSLQEA
ncbi:MAG TPA: hypothetical protein DCY88_07765 [Cyanobacteria bacterium UBA11372]|nr:hypothetical protein [Cyanobacteria bacterium UBA11372]